jgi:hypothetical protein
VVGPEAAGNQGLFRVSLDVAELRLNLAEVLLNIAFCLQHFVTDDPAGGFLDDSFRNSYAALHLMSIDAHDVLLVALLGGVAQRTAADRES